MESSFLETVNHLLSTDNIVRNAAERRYDDAKQGAPVQLVASLFQVVQQTQVEQAVREQAAVLLRQCCGKVKEPESVWSKIGPASQVDVKAKLLQLLEAEQLPKVRRKVADCIQSLGNQLIDIPDKERPKNCTEWPDLMPNLMRVICDNSKDSGIRSDCIWVVKELACSVWQILVSSADQSYHVLQACLADPSDVVRAEAGAMLCAVVDNIETKEERKPFVPLVPEVSKVMVQLASIEDPKHLNTVLQSLQSTTETADFFKHHIASHLMPVLASIAKSHKDEAARKYAFEVILSFIESKPKMVLKVPSYVEQTLEICIHFMMQLNDDTQTWAEEDDEEGEDDEEAYSFGKEAVDRLCRCAAKVEKFPEVLEILKQAITKLFQSGDWKQIIAGISTLSMIAEYVDEEATVSQMIHGIKLQLAATHPRVRHTAWMAIAQFSEDHADVVTTDQWAAQLLPEFLKGLDDPCARVSIRSMEAFQHYGEAVEREDLEPFVQPFMEKLGPKLQAGKITMQKKVITFIAVIAGQVDDAFAPYYSLLMPILKQIIQNILHKVEERTLLGKCFECISLLARAVGSVGFRPDAEQIMQAMIQATQMPNLPSNDPVKEYMMAAAERICGTMKKGFLPFLPHILPGVLEKFTLAPREFNGDAELDDGGEVNLTVMQQDGKMKIMIMYSSEIQDLKSALECVHTFVEELKAEYAPFVAQTAQALLKVFDFSMAEEIRDLAFETWGQLCGSAREGSQVDAVRELVMEFLKRVLPSFEAQQVDLQGWKTSADGITVCLKSAGPGILSHDQVKHICQTALTLIVESLKRRHESGKDQKKEDEDGDVEDDDEEEDEQSLRISLCEVAGSIMHHHADTFVQQSFSDYLAMITQWLQPGAAEEDRRLALFVICDFLEHLQDRVTAKWPQFVPAVIQDTLNANAELRQPACYGISLAAKLPAFAPLAQEAAAKLAEVITKSRGRSKKKSEKIAQACADNALSALVQILLSHPQAVSTALAELWNVWVTGLPCQEDEQEGIKNHKTLLTLLQQERAEVIGEGGQNVPKLLAILIDVYKTDMADDETSKGIGQLTLRLGEARLQGFAQQFSEKQQKKLLRIVRDAQQPSA